MQKNYWMTKEILTIIKKREKLKKEWILSGHIENTPEHIAYKSLRNCVVRMSKFKVQSSNLLSILTV